MNKLRDPIWQFVGTIVALAGVVVSLLKAEQAWLIVASSFGLIVLILVFLSPSKDHRRFDSEPTSLKRITRPIISGGVTLDLIFTFGFLMLIVFMGSVLFFNVLNNSTVLDSPNSENTVVKTICAKSSQSFFGNEVFISVENFSWDGKVNFTVGAPGYSNQLVVDAQNGQSVIYQASGKYEVRLTSVKRFPGDCADFTVTRLTK